MEREESIKKHSSALNPRMLLLKILRLKEKFQAFRIRCIMLILGVLIKEYGEYSSSYSGLSPDLI